MEDIIIYPKISRGETSLDLPIDNQIESVKVNTFSIEFQEDVESETYNIALNNIEPYLCVGTSNVRSFFQAYNGTDWWYGNAYERCQTTISKNNKFSIEVNADQILGEIKLQFKANVKEYIGKHNKYGRPTKEQWFSKDFIDLSKYVDYTSQKTSILTFEEISTNVNKHLDKITFTYTSNIFIKEKSKNDLSSKYVISGDLSCIREIQTFSEAVKESAYKIIIESVDIYAVLDQNKIIQLGSVTIGNGEKVYEYKNNTLFALGNTFNGQPLEEYVGNEIINRFKNGYKSVDMSSILENQKISNGVLTNGIYGVKGTLDRKVINVGEVVVPFRTNKDFTQEAILYEDNKPQRFMVKSNDISYNRSFTQTLSAQTIEFYVIKFNMQLVEVYGVNKDGSTTQLLPNDRLYTNKINIKPIFENVDNEVEIILSVDGKEYLLTSSDGTTYDTITNIELTGSSVIKFYMKVYNDFITATKTLTKSQYGYYYYTYPNALEGYESDKVSTIKVTVKYLENGTQKSMQHTLQTNGGKSNNVTFFSGYDNSIKITFQVNTNYEAIASLDLDPNNIFVGISLDYLGQFNRLAFFG